MLSAQATRVFTLSCCALSVSVLWCVWFLSGASESLGRGRQNAAPPTLRVDTSPSRRDHTHTPTHHAVSVAHLPQTFQGERATKDPGAPLLSAVFVSSSPWQPPGSGAAKIRKTPRLPARMENYLQQMPKTICHKSLHLAGTPQLGKCRKTAQIQKLREDRRSAG